MGSVGEHYSEWCRRIAESRDMEGLIAHFREHVVMHYDRHNREGPISLNIWLVGALNFMHILEKKCPHIKKEDLLFKLCRYHRSHEGGADAPFDVDEFLEKYNGEIKKFHRE